MKMKKFNLISVKIIQTANKYRVNKMLNARVIEIQKLLPLNRDCVIILGRANAINPVHRGYWFSSTCAGE